MAATVVQLGLREREGGGKPSVLPLCVCVCVCVCVSEHSCWLPPCGDLVTQLVYAVAEANNCSLGEVQFSRAVSLT